MEKIVDFPTQEVHFRTEAGRFEEYIKTILEGLPELGLIEYDSEAERSWVELKLARIYRKGLEMSQFTLPYAYPIEVNREILDLMKRQHQQVIGIQFRKMLFNLVLEAAKSFIEAYRERGSKFNKID